MSHIFFFFFYTEKPRRSRQRSLWVASFRWSIKLLNSLKVSVSCHLWWRSCRTTCLYPQGRSVRPARGCLCACPGRLKTSCWKEDNVLRHLIVLRQPLAPPPDPLSLFLSLSLLLEGRIHSKLPREKTSVKSWIPSWIFKSNTNFVQFFSIAERGVVLAGVPAEAAEGRWCGRTTVSRVVVIVKRVINIIIISSRSRSSSWSSRSGGDSARDYHSDTTRKSWKDEGGTERRAMQ